MSRAQRPIIILWNSIWHAASVARTVDTSHAENILLQSQEMKHPFQSWIMDSLNYLLFFSFKVIKFFMYWLWQEHLCTFMVSARWLTIDTRWELVLARSWHSNMRLCKYIQFIIYCTVLCKLVLVTKSEDEVEFNLSLKISHFQRMLWHEIRKNWRSLLIFFKLKILYSGKILISCSKWRKIPYFTVQARKFPISKFPWQGSCRSLNSLNSA